MTVAETGRSTWSDHRIDLAVCQHAGDRGAFRRILNPHIMRQIQRNLFDAARMVVAVANPGHIGGFYAMLVLQHGPGPHVGGDLIFRHANALTFQVL
jgi:hypothetical protein